MIEPADRRRAADIVTVVRAVPGVTEVFPVGGIVSRVIDAGAQALGIQDEGESLVRVERSPDGIRVEAAIGVDDAAGAVETIHRVQAAISGLCADRLVTTTEIRVTVVHVADAPAQTPW